MGYIRPQSATLARRLAEPGRFIQVTGPRQVGKTTLVQQVTESSGLARFASADEHTLRGPDWTSQQYEVPAWPPTTRATAARCWMKSSKFLAGQRRSSTCGMRTGAPNGRSAWCCRGTPDRKHMATASAGPHTHHSARHAAAQIHLRGTASRLVVRGCFEVSVVINKYRNLGIRESRLFRIPEQAQLLLGKYSSHLIVPWTVSPPVYDSSASRGRRLPVQQAAAPAS